MPDVNVLVAAHRSDAAHHEEVRAWLEEAVNGNEAVGLSDAVATGFVRVVTHRRVFREPTPVAEALAQIGRLQDSDRVLRVTPGRAYWSIFDGLCREADARGNLVADAAHAATVIEAGATWITFDRDFTRFPGLSWRVPTSAE